MTVSVLTIVRQWLEGSPRPTGSPLPPATAGRIRAVQINAIANNSPVVMLAAIFNALVVRIGLDRLADPFLNVWTAVIIGTSAWFFLWRLRRRHKVRPASASPRGIRLAVMRGLFFGLVWAAIPFLYFGRAAPDEQLIITCIVVGMIFGGAFTLAAVPAAMLAFIVPIVVGSATAIASLGHATSLLLAGLLVVYTAVLLTTGARFASQLGARVINHVIDEEAARMDFLTGLPNRLAFKAHLSDRLAEDQADPARLALFYFDLDHFKTINDRMGHEAGDVILVQAAKRLREITRQTDFVARLGGDEFVLVVESFPSDDMVLHLAERINESFREPFAVLGENVSSTISIGIAFLPEAGTDFDLVLRRADAALYAAKRDRSCYAVWQKDLTSAGEDRIMVTRELSTHIATSRPQSQH
ncbi:diguanylate cyclase domain-containing protein [Methylocella sp. CPCC 101449]|uniref:diguanylate cyclase domain-containing protein n=1 Tax=Methylocella sp. CPCC 101449 TaxID=2987531 RepID=UPI00288DA246|nr:diguanylate cyclase [Methylocella sp. CPCC 101449]MDT2023658.1 diguanylate cyclase [Methylocella sp. CPCC 101449]